MYGIKRNGYDGYTPADLNSDSSEWIDFLTTSHDTDKDTFMIMTIPMSTLGVTADKVASEGIGVMSISTFGASGIGSCPQDLSMLDVACDPYGPDESTSAEKEDEDTVTTKLAQLGGSVDNPIKTPKPITSAEVTATPDSSVATATPEVTPCVTATPEATDSSVATATPEATDSSVATAIPEVTPHVVATPIVPEDTDQMVVNFGAEKAAPQVAGTTLKLEAKPYNTTLVSISL
jgi:hypothetical protein